jgi:hypothetical protein
LLNKAQLETWDVPLLIKHLQRRYSTNNNLSLQALQMKTILLLCIATMWRPRSDIGCLQHRDIIFKQENQGIISVTIHARHPKEAQQKTMQLGLGEDQQLCPVRMLYTFIQQTTALRTHLQQDHTLFLAYLNNPSKSVTSVRPSTVAKWIQDEMKEAGVDTAHFKAHSIRLASKQHENC